MSNISKRIKSVVTRGKKIVDNAKIRAAIITFHPGGNAVSLDAQPPEIVDLTTNTKEQSFFSRKNNILEADWGTGPVLESGNFGAAHLDYTPRLTELQQYTETKSTEDEGQTPSYKSYYERLTEPEPTVEIRTRKGWLSDDHLKNEEDDILFEDDVRLLESHINYAKPMEYESNIAEWDIIKKEYKKKVSETLEQIRTSHEDKSNTT